jgi:hypothetical protein
VEGAFAVRQGSQGDVIDVTWDRLRGNRKAGHEDVGEVAVRQGWGGRGLGVRIEHELRIEQWEDMSAANGSFNASRGSKKTDNKAK